MDQPSVVFGLTWAQIAIFGVCFAILLAVCVAVVRGFRRGRKTHRLKSAPIEPMSRRAERKAEERTRPRTDPALAAGRAEPSLTRAAPASASAGDPGPETAKALATLDEQMADLVGAYNDAARVIKTLKGEIDQLRHTATLSDRRIEALEKALQQKRSTSTPAPEPAGKPSVRKPPPLEVKREPTLGEPAADKPGTADPRAATDLFASRKRREG